MSTDLRINTLFTTIQTARPGRAAATGSHPRVCYVERDIYVTLRRHSRSSGGTSGLSDAVIGPVWACFAPVLAGTWTAGWWVVGRYVDGVVSWGGWCYLPQPGLGLSVSACDTGNGPPGRPVLARGRSVCCFLDVTFAASWRTACTVRAVARVAPGVDLPVRGKWRFQASWCHDQVTTWRLGRPVWACVRLGSDSVGGLRGGS